MRWDSGHGTYVDSEEVIASVAGTVERVNKLVTVRAIRSRSLDKSLDLTIMIWKVLLQVQSRGWRSCRRAHNWGKLKSSSWSKKSLNELHRYSPGDGRWMLIQGRMQFLCYLPSTCPVACRLGIPFFEFKLTLTLVLLICSNDVSKASKIRKRRTPDARIFRRRRSLSGRGASLLFWWVNVASHTITQVWKGIRN